MRELAEGTKQNYRDQVRLHVLPAFEHYTLARDHHRPGRVVPQVAGGDLAPRGPGSRGPCSTCSSASRLRHDAIARNPVEGTSPLRQPEEPAAGAHPRADRRDPRRPPRTGEANRACRVRSPTARSATSSRCCWGPPCAPARCWRLRPCDIEDRPTGMVASVTGTVVQRKGSGAVRQDRPKTDASIRRIPVPEFAAAVLRRRLARRAERDATDDLRQPQRRPAQPVQRPPHLPGVPARSPVSRTPGSACAGTGAPARR